MKLTGGREMEKFELVDRGSARGILSSAGGGIRGAIERECNRAFLKASIRVSEFIREFQARVRNVMIDERGDVPGWVLVVLMTTGLVTGIWTVAAPRIESLLRGSLDAMNNVR